MLAALLVTVAALCTLAGAAALLVAFVLPAADTLSAVFAIVLGLPWPLILGAWEPAPGATPVLATATVTGVVAVNAAKLP